jgi:tetratricopeptide (TPR) repeat protein
MMPVRVLLALLSASLLLCCAQGSQARPAHLAKLTLPPGAHTTVEKIYGFDINGALEDARRMERERPEHPLGYLLETEALWWKIWCLAAEFKYGMNDARRRPKLASDQYFLDLAQKVSSLAEAQLKLHETAEMHFYAGMGDAQAARLYGLRFEGRNTARAGVRAREHLLRAIALDPGLADADLGLGLYNYYIDTLSSMTKVLRFFMGIPGGSKQEGIRQLEFAIAQGELTPDAARFYLALNLHRYDQQYERALRVIGPLADKYPGNPLFQLARGDLYAKLGRKEQAGGCYHAAAAIVLADSECREHIQKLARESLASLGMSATAASR